MNTEPAISFSGIEKSKELREKRKHGFKARDKYFSGDTSFPPRGKGPRSANQRPEDKNAVWNTSLNGSKAPRVRKHTKLLASKNRKGRDAVRLNHRISETKKRQGHNKPSRAEERATLHAKKETQNLSRYPPQKTTSKTKSRETPFRSSLAPVAKHTSLRKESRDLMEEHHIPITPSFSPPKQEQSKEEPLDEASSQEGDNGIYEKKMDRAVPCKGDTTTYEVRMPMLQTSDSEGNPEKEDIQSDIQIEIMFGDTGLPVDGNTDVPKGLMTSLETLELGFTNTEKSEIGMSEDLTDEMHEEENDNVSESEKEEEEEPKFEEEEGKEEEEDAILSIEEKEDTIPETTHVCEKEEEKSSADCYDDFDDEDAKEVGKNEIEGKKTLEYAFKRALDEFKAVYMNVTPFNNMQYPQFLGKMKSTRNKIHMVQANMNSFRTALMHAVFLELKSKCKKFIKVLGPKIRKKSNGHLALLKKKKNLKDVEKKLDQFIAHAAEKSYEFKKDFYEELFLPAVVNRALRKPIYPLELPKHAVDPEDGLPNYLNAMGKLIEMIITRGLYTMDISNEPFELSWSDWKKIDLDAWDCDDETLKAAYKKREVIENRAAEKSQERRKLQSPLQCALTGIPIFPGDLVHAVRVVLRDPVSKMDTPTIEERTHCLLFHAKIEEYNPPKKDDGYEPRTEEQMIDCSRGIISVILRALSIISDSYFHEDKKRMPLWYISKARDILGFATEDNYGKPSDAASDTESDIVRNEESGITFEYILESPKNIEDFVENILYAENHLEELGKMYAQQKFALQTVRHMMDMFG